MRLIEQRNLFRSTLEKHYEVSEIDDLFKRAIVHYFSWSTLKIGLEPQYELSTEEERQLDELLTELTTGRPFQYCIGTAYFMELKLKVDPGVLIPRPETEELIEWVLSENDYAEQKVWDICSGSGCIALALKNSQPEWSITGFDISTAALSIARQNANELGLDVSFEEENVLEWKSNEIRCDLIVSNPPYVLPSEKARMHANVLEHEPGLALFVPEEDPLLFYRKIIEIASAKLAAGGGLYFEINPFLVDELIMLGKANGFPFSNVKKDIFGKDRFVKFSQKK